MLRYVVPENDLGEIIDYADESLRSLDGAKILILGGTGFVGKWLLSTLDFAKRALNVRCELHVVTRFSQKAKEELGFSDIELIEHDLSRSVLKLPNADYYIHAATPSVPSRGSGNPRQVANATLNGTLSIFGAVSESKNTKGILYLSSGAVYGQQSADQYLQPEKSVKWPNSTLNSYGCTKLLSEIMFSQVQLETGVPISAPRLFAFFGPHISLNDHFAIGNFLRDARAGGPIRILGNPKTIRSFMYPTDLVINLLQLLVFPENRPINIGSAVPRTLLTVAEEMSSMFGELPIELLGSNLQASRYAPETEWIHSGKGHKPRVEFREGLLRWNSWLNQVSRSSQGTGF